jgi:hypothetical protein
MDVTERLTALIVIGSITEMRRSLDANIWSREKLLYAPHVLLTPQVVV